MLATHAQALILEGAVVHMKTAGGPVVTSSDIEAAIKNAAGVAALAADVAVMKQTAAALPEQLAKLAAQAGEQKGKGAAALAAGADAIKAAGAAQQAIDDLVAASEKVRRGAACEH